MAVQQIKQGINSHPFTGWHRVLLAFCLFMAAGALFGGMGGYIAPVFFGSEELVPVFQKLPYVGQYVNSLAIPASALLIFMFIPHSIAVVLLLKKHLLQYPVGIICGLFLIVFTSVELLIIPNPASWLFLFFGVAETVIAVICLRVAK